MIQRACRWLARLLLTALLVCSALSFLWSAQRIASNPLLRPVIERAAQDFAATLEMELARRETGPEIIARLEALLDESPRNWVAIEAVETLAQDLKVALPEQLSQARAAAWEEDSGYLAMAGSCAMCFWDASNCSLSEALICNAPVQMTPIGDLAGLTKAGINAATGNEIDKLDAALSAIGLGATAAGLATGGSSLTLKAGAGFLKMARKMALLSPKLMDFLLDVARRGIRWDEALRLDSLSDPARLLRPEIVRPAAALASDIGRIGARLDPSETLMMLRHIDGPQDARRLADATSVMGRKAVGTIEVIGKSRFMRAALRMSNEALALVSGLIGTIISLAMALGGMVQALSGRWLRQVLRQLAR